MVFCKLTKLKIWNTLCLLRINFKILLLIKASKFSPYIHASEQKKMYIDSFQPKALGIVMTQRQEYNPAVLQTPVSCYFKKNMDFYTEYKLC